MPLWSKCGRKMTHGLIDGPAWLEKQRKLVFVHQAVEIQVLLARSCERCGLAGASTQE